MTVSLHSSFTDNTGILYNLEYVETDLFAELLGKNIRQCYGFAFHNGKMVLVNNINNPSKFGPVGGGVEIGEHPDETLIREIREESNMNVLKFLPIGYQKVSVADGSIEEYYQLRYFCVVEPYGPFTEDPAGDVTKVIEINPQDYQTYFNWGEIGESIMNRALTLLAQTS